MRELPLIDDVEIPPLGLDLRDTRRLHDSVGIVGRKILVEVIEEHIAGIQRNVFICNGVNQQSFEDALFKAAQVREPGISWSDFLEAEPTLVPDDSATNPRLSVLHLAAFTPARGRTLLGLFTLYNVVIERDEARGLTLSAMAMPGCRNAPGKTQRETWGGIMRWLLEHDLTIGGRVIDVIEWRFPTRREHRWKTSPEQLDRVGRGRTIGAVPERGIFVADLDGHDLTKDEDDVPLKVRRREART